ncbi:hypothetical protein B0H17DRAFT_1330971 [Mycena rosella]|uniref:F-box domain-containing protein n=1 Tax=Mycena rosella TaxID=1033263 RepID=A0AAD7DH91_MYCRO|nr:hypothetical protein B0H17DRAFT_1330971 [Mycena rosella]
MSLLSLPNEVLLVVFCHLDDPYPLFPLSTLCRRLHFLCLPVYLLRRGVYDDSSCNISIAAEQVDALPALQTSLFLGTVQSLFCTFSNPYSQNKDLARFHRVCCMLTSIRKAQLRFTPPSDDYPGGTQEEEAYFTQVVDILNKVLEKSCTTLTVDTPLGATPATSSRKRGLQHGLARGTRQPAILTSSISLSPGALRRRSLSTFRIHSETLFAPHCRAWTLDVLNSFPLTSLSIHAPSVPTAALDALLSQTEIPTLSDLALVHCRITPARLHLFLALHPSITTLHLDNLLSPRTLSATPAQLAYLLHAMPPPPALRTVRIHSHMTHVDLRLADASLRPAAPRLVPRQSRSRSSSPALRAVSTLEFVFADADAGEARGFAVYAAIAKWAAPFPGLQTVELVGSSAGADTARILAAFQARVPGVEKMVWRTNDSPRTA